jgi:hypothetical protein
MEYSKRILQTAHNINVRTVAVLIDNPGFAGIILANTNIGMISAAISNNGSFLKKESILSGFGK